MILLVLCSSIWVLLTTALVSGISLLPTPWDSQEMVLLLLLTASVIAFARIGATSLLCLSLRLLPANPLRTRLARGLLRRAPAVLRSSAASALAVALIVSPAQVAGASSPAPDPSWPTASGRPPDPAWPTIPAGSEGNEDSDGNNGSGHSIDDESAPAPPEPTGASDRDSPVMHIVVRGESLWSIAADRISSDGTAQPAEISRLVDDIHQRNRGRIGPDPNLIVSGQRLEIRP